MVSCNLKKVTVFCASRYGNNEDFALNAKKLGKEIAKNGLTLVYGSSVDGLMGAFALSVLENDGKVIGINTKDFKDCKQPQNDNFTYIIYDNIEQRQRALIDTSDAFVVFTGGFGTLFEYYHVINLMLIKAIPKKPIVIVNLDGTYDNFIKLNNELVNLGLASNIDDFQTIVTSIDEVIPALKKMAL